MARVLSLYRRRPNLIDLTLQSGPYAPSAIGLAAGKVAASYQFKISSTFDGSVGFQNLQVVPASGGYGSPTVQQAGFDSEQFSQSRTPYLTRFKFSPADYATIFAGLSISDTTPFWLQVVQTNLDGSSNSASAPHMIQPFPLTPNRAVILNGTAPSAASLAGSLEIQLPMQVNNIQIQNNGTNILQVAFEPTGPEFTVNPSTAGADINLYTAYNSSSQLFVRGAGGTTAFNFIGALRNNPL